MVTGWAHCWVFIEEVPNLWIFFIIELTHEKTADVSGKYVVRHAVERLHWTAGFWKDGQPTEHGPWIRVNVNADTVPSVDAASLTVSQRPTPVC